MFSRAASAWIQYSCCRALLVGALLAGILSQPALAQILTNGSIRGIARDPQGAVLPGVVLTATSGDAPGEHKTTTDSNGSYRLLDLAPGTYHVTAQLDGFATLLQDVVVRAGLNVGLDLMLTVGGRSETVTVTSEPPLLETRSAVTAVNISGELQRSLPLSGRRDWADFLLITPGVISKEGAGFTNYALHGSGLNSHVLQVDGADMASATTNTNQYIALSTEALNDVQVKTAATDASAPLGLGAVVNVSTRSGTNVFSGSASFVFQPLSWNGSNIPGGTSTTIGRTQPDVSFGGPIQAEHTWIFGTYRRTQQEVGLSRTPAQLGALKALVPGFAPFNNETRGNSFFVKVTNQFTRRQQLSAFAQYDVLPTDSNTGIYAGRFAQSEPGGTAYGVRLSSVWSQNLTTRTGVSYNDKSSPLVAARTDMPGTIVYSAASLVSGRLVGSGPLAILGNYPSGGLDDVARKATIAFDMTYLRDGLFGSHEFQAGAYLQPLLRIRQTTQYPTDGFVLEEAIPANPSDLSAGVVPFHRQIFDSTRLPQKYADAIDNAVYVQDAWRPWARLTVNAGLRVDHIRQTDKVFNVPTQQSTEIGPRFGAIYLLSADAHQSVRASWTRVHETPSQTSVSAGSTTSGFRDEYDLDRNGTFETTFVTPGSSALSPNLKFDLDRWHQPYVNEWTVGYRSQLPGRLTLDAGWISREFRDRAAGVDVNAIYDGNQFLGYRDQSQNAIYLVTNNVWNWPVYSALELQATKQTARVQLIASYTRQWRHLNGTWQPNDPAAIIQPDAFPDDRGIGSTRGTPGGAGDANSLSGSQGVASGAEWHDHTFRAGGSVLGPWGLLLATNYVFQTGVWSGPVVTRLNAPDPQFGPATLQLSNGRVVSNPLATTIRLLGPTRSDGQFTLSNLHVWNARIGRQFRLLRSKLEVAADVFNITNHDADQSFMTGTNQVYSANYRLGTTRQLPRSADVFVRIAF